MIGIVMFLGRTRTKEDGIGGRTVFLGADSRILSFGTGKMQITVNAILLSALLRTTVEGKNG